MGIIRLSPAIEETKTTAKKILKYKLPGIDGIPAELYKKIDYIIDWLQDATLVLLKHKQLIDMMKPPYSNCSAKIMLGTKLVTRDPSTNYALTTR